MPHQGSSVRPSRIPVLTRSPRRIPLSTDNENVSELSQNGKAQVPDLRPRDSEIMEYHEILSNPLGAQQEPTPRLDSAPATIFENNPSFLQETPSKQSSPQQESPTKRTRSKRSILGFPKREKKKTLDAVPPVKKSFLSATKDSLARAMRGGSRSQSNSAAVTAAINAVDERLGHTDTENKQNREIVQCLFRAAECYNKANISAKQAENFAKDAKRHADEAREEVVKISELLRHAGFDDETVRRLDNMIRTVAEVGLE